MSRRLKWAPLLPQRRGFFLPPVGQLVSVSFSAAAGHRNLAAGVTVGSRRPTTGAADPLALIIMKSFAGSAIIRG